jgi:hypothetical protein
MGDQGHTPSDQILGADEMDIDDDLQVAIMLSMQQVKYSALLGFKNIMWKRVYVL